MEHIIGFDAVTCNWQGVVSHKRLFAICHTQNYPDIGAELIRRGFALDCRRYSGGRYKKLEPPDARKRLPSKRYC